MVQFKKNMPYPSSLGGFIVPKEFIIGCNLATIERILGFKHKRLIQGAIFVQLDALPKIDDLEYYGDTSVPAHNFEDRRNKQISAHDLSKAAFNYLQPTTKLIKVIPLDDPQSKKIENQQWPAGKGAMQYKLKYSANKRGTIVDLIKDYPNGLFQGA